MSQRPLGVLGLVLLLGCGPDAVTPDGALPDGAVVDGALPDGAVLDGALPDAGPLELPPATRAVGPAEDCAPYGDPLGTAQEVALAYTPGDVAEGEELRVMLFDRRTGQMVGEFEVTRLGDGTVYAVTDACLTSVPVAVPIRWWDRWPRIHNGSTLAEIQAAGANVANAAGGADEGRGPLFRDADFISRSADTAALKAAGVKVLPWIENQGDARSFIMAVQRDGIGGYVQDAATGAAKIFAHFWCWELLPTTPETEIVWAGLHTYANEEAWLGDMTRTNPLFATPVPTYPDGTPAVGYLGDDASSPANARLYDAMASKDLNGNPRPAWGEYFGATKTGMVPVDVDGTTHYMGDVSFGKDQASPWWEQYNRTAVRYFAELRMDGFWFDNYSGFDFIGAWPINRAFGEWSVALFNNFLADHPEITVPGGSASFDIRAYLKGVLTTWYPGADPTDLGHSGWSDARWLDDPLWRAFLVFKGVIGGERARGLHRIVKEEAFAAGIANPDAVVVTGNDIPDLTYCGFTGEEVNLVSTEFNPSWRIPTGGKTLGLPPLGGAGPFYAVATRYGRSRHAAIWYYVEGVDFRSGIDTTTYRDDEKLGELLGFEALANNTLLIGSHVNPANAGTPASQQRVHAVIERLTPVLGRRERRGRVAILYSTETQYSTFTPSGDVVAPSDNHTLAYSGWASALEDLRVPYRAIPDFRLRPAELYGVDVLILPHVRSFDGSMVDSVLMPFLQAGGALVMTGDAAGAISTHRGLYAPNSGALLAGLATQDVAPGRVVKVAGNPGYDYHVDPARVAGRAAIEATLTSLRDSGHLAQELEVAMGPRVRTVLHEDPFAARVELDLVNTDLDLPSGVWQPASAGTVTFTVPALLEGLTLHATGYDADGTDGTALPLTTLGDGRVRVDVPAFNRYLLVVLEKAP